MIPHSAVSTTGPNRSSPEVSYFPFIPSCSLPNDMSGILLTSICQDKQANCGVIHSMFCPLLLVVTASLSGTAWMWFTTLTSMRCHLIDVETERAWSVCLVGMSLDKQLKWVFQKHLVRVRHTPSSVFQESMRSRFPKGKVMQTRIIIIK